MSDLIIQTRITPKKSPENIIARNVLLKKLNDNFNKNIILVVAPAGYGKTTLVQDFVSKADLRFSWLHCSSDIDSFSTFIKYVIHSLKNINAGFGTKTLEILDSVNMQETQKNLLRSAIQSVIGTFINEIMNDFGENVYLIIDDFHLLGDSDWVNETFSLLTDNFPENLHIIITSRSLPKFNQTKLLAKRNMIKIESSELNFSLEETANLLKDIYNLSVPASEINDLKDKTEGWVTGLHLIIQAYGKNFSKTISDKKFLDENLFNFFAEDIFNLLEPQLKDFLLHTSLLDNFTPEMCEDIFGYGQSTEYLNQLSNSNIFIETTIVKYNDEQAYAYNYHNLFRNFLTSKLNIVNKPVELRKLYEKIFRYYKENNQIINAVNFSLSAGLYEESAEMINQIFDSALDDGRYETLNKWFKSIPENTYNKNPQLLFKKGLFLKSYNPDAEHYYKIFTELTSNKIITGDKNLEGRVNIEIADYHAKKGETDKAIKMLLDLLSKKPEPVYNIKLIMALCRAYYRAGLNSYSEIIKLLDENIPFILENNLKEILLEAYGMYAKIYLSTGDFIKSAHYYENCLTLENNILRRFGILCDTVILFSRSAEFVRAKENLDKVNRLYNDYPNPNFERAILNSAGYLKFEAGDYEDAISYFLKLNEFYLKNDLKAYMIHSYLVISECYIFLKDFRKAEEYLSLASDILDDKDEYFKLEVEFHNAILQKAENKQTPIEKILNKAYKYFKDRNLTYGVAQIQFHLADYFFRKNQLQTAIKFLNDSLIISKEKQYISYLTQWYFLSRNLFDTALINNIHKDFVENARDVLLERENYEWFSLKAKQRIKKENQFLCDINLKTFGGAEIFVRGKAVPESVWIRKKSKQIFIYLMIYPGTKFTKDKMLGMFFGDQSANTAENVFHQAITNIRNALKTDSENITLKNPKSENTTFKTAKKSESFPQYIKYEDKILRLSPGYLFKSDTTDFNIHYNLVKSAESSIETRVTNAKAAIELYRGDFLPEYYDDWIEDLRLIYQNRFIELCEILLGILTEEKKYEDVIFYAEKIIEYDKLHEVAYYKIIEAYVKLNNAAMAKKKYAQFTESYEKEYGEKPSVKTTSKISAVLPKV